MLNQNIKVAADSMIFCKNEGTLQLLLIKRKNDPGKGMWAFPGGFVEDGEELEAAAIRELQEETGLEMRALKQLHTFATVGRDPRFRSLSVIHYAIVDTPGNVKGDDDAAEAKWVNVKDITEMAFDHKMILDFALQQLEKELNG